MQMTADGTFFLRRLESGRGFSEMIMRSGRCFVCGEMLGAGMWRGLVALRLWFVALRFVACGLWLEPQEERARLMVNCFRRREYSVPKDHQTRLMNLSGLEIRAGVRTLGLSVSPVTVYHCPRCAESLHYWHMSSCNITRSG